jgi:hypothetical protein
MAALWPPPLTVNDAVLAPPSLRSCPLKSYDRRAHLRRPTCLFHSRHRGQFRRKEEEHDDIPSDNSQACTTPRRRPSPRSNAGIREPHHCGTRKRREAVGPSVGPGEGCRAASALQFRLRQALSWHQCPDPQHGHACLPGRRPTLDDLPAGTGEKTGRSGRASARPRSSSRSLTRSRTTTTKAARRPSAS